MVKYLECGFLSLREKTSDRTLVEVDEDFRERGHLHAIQQQTLLHAPICFARKVNLWKEIEATEPETPHRQEKTLRTLQSDRSCKGFTSWTQGFTPKEHREMLDRHGERRWRIFEIIFVPIVIIVAAVVGALIQR